MDLDLDALSSAYPGPRDGSLSTQHRSREVWDADLIFKSHEGLDAREKWAKLGGMDIGYATDMSGKLITLLSAPDYPQFQIGEQNECYFEDFFLLHNFKHEIGDLKAIFLQDY